MTSFDAASIAALALIGLFAGLFGGLVGIGGSIIMIPAMTEVFGPRQHLYQAAAMIVNFFVAVPAFFQHLRARAVMGHIVRSMAPLAVVGVIMGVLLSEVPAFRGEGQAWLIGLFGLFLFGDGVHVARPLLRSRSRVAPQPALAGDAPGWKVALIAGLPVGLVGGLLGVGGGILAVPLQSRYFHIPLRNAIANSAATIIALSLIGACSKNYALVTNHPEYQLGDSLALAGVLIPTAIVGSLIGARLTHTLPLRVVRGVLAAFLFITAVRMMLLGWTGVTG